MSLRILLADDSMTAQNMGKKILSDAGYEVVAVSNGAAALKKATELKPDLVVLDIYMPGYTGLEVCERLKNAPETSRIPVVLTVGKLEPYRPEEGARVRAEGVIIKPFEATDLIAAVQKITSKAAEVPEPAPPVKEPEPLTPFAVTAPEPVAQVSVAAPILPDFSAQPAASAGAISAAAFAMPALDIGPLDEIPAAPIAPHVETHALAQAATTESNAGISLDFLKSPVLQPVPSHPIEILEPVSDEVEHVIPATPAITVDPALATDPADMAEFLAKVTAAPPAPEHVEERPSIENELPPLSEPGSHEMAGSLASEPGIDPMAFSLADTQPIPHMPEQMPEGAGAAAIELFHDEYGPAADGSIDLSVPSYQRAEPPKKPIFAENALSEFAQTPAMDEYLVRQEQEHAEATPPQNAPAEVIPPPMPSPLEIAEPLPAGTSAPLAAEWSNLLDELPTAPAEEPQQVAAVNETNPLEVGETFDLGVIDEAPEVAAPVEAAPVSPEPAESEPAPVLEAVHEEPVVTAELPIPTAIPEPVLEPAPVAAETVPPAQVAEPVLESNEEPPTAALESALEPEASLPEPSSNFLASLVPAAVAAAVPAAVAAVAVAVEAPKVESKPEPEIAHVAETVVEPEPAAAVEPEPVTDVAPIPTEAVPAEVVPVLETAPEPVTEAAPVVQNVEPEVAATEVLSAVDRARIAGAVQRVFDRYKPQIIAEITRELMKD